MSNLPRNADRLGELAGAVCSKGASQDDFVELNVLLLSDEAARRFYLRYCQVHVAMRLELHAERAAQKICRHIGSEPPSREVGEYDIASNRAERGEHSSPPPMFDLSSAPGQGIVTYLAGWPVAYLVATVIFAIGLVVAALVHVSQPSQIVTPSSPHPSPLTPLPAAVARITGMVDCEWEGSGLPSPARGRGAGGEGSPNSVSTNDPHRPNQKSEIVNHNSPLHLGDRLALRSGLLELTYDTGAVVILQGPVAYEVDSPTGGRLSLGKLTARLEKRVASGQWSVVSGQKSTSPQSLAPSPPSNPQSLIPNPLFAIRTPTAIVTDLGTEFGVEVAGDGKTTSHVFRGSVIMRVTAADDASAGREMILKENESGRVERGAVAGNRSIFSISRFVAEPLRFARVLPPSHIDRSNAYGQLVLSLKPAAYYRMEESEEGQDQLTVFDSSPGAHHGVLSCDRAAFCPPHLAGRFGKSLLFRGAGVQDHAIVSDYPKAVTDQLTVSAWVKATTRPVRWSMIASNWGDDKYTGQFHFGMHRFDGDLSVNVTQRNGQYVELREGEPRPLPLGVWQHVAFVADGSTLRLYRNGVQVAAMPCAGILPQPPMAGLGIGCKTNDAGTDVAADSDCPAYWAGCIDELAIFNRALSMEQIKTLHEGPRDSGAAVRDLTLRREQPTTESRGEGSTDIKQP